MQTVTQSSPAISIPSTQTISDDLRALRQTSPLVHNMTNYVAMQMTANALLALGASPIMAHADDELADIIGISQALVINIGTLDASSIQQMKTAVGLAAKKTIPIILDPVGAGATKLRTDTSLALLRTHAMSIVRGNASEIMALVDNKVETKGVDSTQNSLAALSAARYLATHYQCVVVVSGAVDLIVDQQHCYRVHNGVPLMAKVTAMGCTATALVAALAAINSNKIMAATHAMAILGIAGELAAKLAKGPGTLVAHLLDALYSLNTNDLSLAKVDCDD